jgi:hypothetical protein
MSLSLRSRMRLIQPPTSIQAARAKGDRHIHQHGESDFAKVAKIIPILDEQGIVTAQNDDTLDSPKEDVDVEVDDMGVIRKKTATRGGEGGVKYVCDVCSADITSTVSLWRKISPLLLYSSCGKSNHTIPRSAFDAPHQFATNTIFVYSVFPMQRRPATMNYPIPFALSNRTQYRYMTRTGEPTRSCYYLKVAKYTA